MTDEIEAIRARHEALEALGHLAHHDWASEAHDDRATLLRLLDAAREDVERLEAALKPFADFEEAIRQSYQTHRDTDSFYIYNMTAISMGDFRRARAALKGT